MIELSDDFFMGNVNDDDESPPVETIYVDSESKYREEKKPRNVPCNNDEDSNSNSNSSYESIHNRRKSAEATNSGGDNNIIVLESSESDEEDINYQPPLNSRSRNTKNSSKTTESVFSRSVTPTKRIKRSRVTASSCTSNNFFEPDENDEFFAKIAKEIKHTSAGIRVSTPAQPRRIYNVRFLSKLDGSIDKAVQIKVLGKYDFASILPSVLNGFIREYKIPNPMKKIYSAENVTLYWKTAKLLNFMNCNFLKIPQFFENEISDIDVTVISKEQENNFEKMITSKALEEEQDQPTVIDLEDAKFEQFEKELRNVRSSYSATRETTEIIDLEDEDDVELIKVALVGDDNKKIFVHVRNSTTLNKVADYYRMKKKLPDGVNVRLIFDHEELNLNETIGKQDMEDEDMIEVVVQ